MKKYSTAHAYQTSGRLMPKVWKKIWEIQAVPRVRVFIWRVCSDAMPTKVNLMRRGWRERSNL